MSPAARSAFAVVLVGALAVVGRGFSPGMFAQAPQQPTFRSGVQLIEVDVRVFDADGRFVTDLTKDDFEVVEQGTPQRIDAMYLVRGARSDRSTASSTSTTPQLKVGPTGAPAAPQTWVFFFDLNHLTPGGGFDRARKAVEEFIAKRFKEGDVAGVVAGDKMVNNRLTSVRQELLDAVKQVRPRSDSRTRMMELLMEWPRLLNQDEAIRIARNEPEPIQRATTRACTDDPIQCRMADQAVREKGQRIASEIHRATLATLNTVNVLSFSLAKISGPKTVVFIADGFEVQNIETTLRSVVGQTTRAGARVYAIDVRGANRSGTADPQQMQVTDEAGPVSRFDDVADGPNSLAVDTGGMMIRNENNLGRALDRIADDAATYYVLAYQPANTTFDGKYRTIEVKVKRPGVRVRARRGYLALEPAKMLKPQPITTSVSVPGKLPLLPRNKLLLPSRIAPVPNEPALTAGPASGAVVATPETSRADSMRLRPDSEERIKALSARGGTAGSEFATQGWDAYQRGDVETALSSFTQAAARGDVRPWVLYATGLSQAALGRGAEAIVSWERVRQAAPDFEPVYMDLADTYAQSGDLTHALAVLRDAEKRWPKDGDVQSAIGVIHVRRGALDEGIAALLKAADAKPDDPLAHLNLGRAYELRFHRGRRYVASQRRWVAPEEDRTKAAQAYERCIKLGGPYALKAAEALSMLQWGKGTQGGAAFQ